MNHRIIVCDDDLHITRAVSMKLRRAGFDVEVCRDGRYGLEASERKRPDLVITDYQMPRLDGFGLIAGLRELPGLDEVPVILLTAKGYELDHEQIKAEFRVTEVLVKPFSPRELLSLVNSILAIEAPVGA